jgi:acyl carrier protein
MENYAQVEQTVKEILAKQVKMDVANIKPESSLAEDLRMDSFSAVETAFDLEEKFGIQIPNEALSNVKTVKDIVDYIFGQIQSKTSV